ncbi:MAG: bifunctional helix-turn-helix domain-containing protein/methylated-DNA--[protein]-cysteine S-methyltransferase [Holophaga sp.]|nr:bifunctional helix-turn-helix domain-containing protein/methylated-DNA--[protein]-cysteine S-methyltransferase [Holophaga sp.]
MSQSDFSRVAQAIRFLCDQVQAQPSLGEVAAQAGVSEFHFQRMFQKWAGISPKRFLQFLTLREAKGLLLESRSLLEASLELGLSSPSRLHDLFVTIERITPGQFKQRAQGLTLAWTVAETPFGPALMAALEGRLCALSFLAGADPAEALAELGTRWPRARLQQDPAALQPSVAALERRFRGEPPQPLALALKGTPFQLKVWEALLRIPEGRVLAYGDLARQLGEPGAGRAIGTAVGRNPVGYLIPCHRVIQASGALGDYHWGAGRKRAILALERARGEQAGVA